MPVLVVEDCCLLVSSFLTLVLSLAVVVAALAVAAQLAELVLLDVRSTLVAVGAAVVVLILTVVDLDGWPTAAAVAKVDNISAGGTAGCDAVIIILSVGGLLLLAVD